MVGTPAGSMSLAIVFLQHFLDESAVFRFVAVSAAAFCPMMPVQTVLSLLAMYLAAMLAAGMCRRKMVLALVDMVAGNNAIGFKAVILLGLRAAAVLDATAGCIAQPAAGDPMRALFLHLVSSVLVIRVHVTILAGGLINQSPHPNTKKPRPVRGAES